MMYQKAKLFGDNDTAVAILNASDQKIQKSLGRLVKGFDPHIWDENKEMIVDQGNYYKFTQNKIMLIELLSTEDRKLVEASRTDLVWGVGLDQDDPLILDEKNWKGQNLLGKVLTNLRDRLKNGDL